MSMASFVHLFEWLSQHPVSAALLVFVIALSESLAFVGLIVPGIFFMVVFGALVTTGYLDYGWTVTAAILGAITGDGISYWLGQRYHKQLYNFWPFRNRPGLLKRGEAFFHRHGGKSILLGRFVGPLRPVIPAIAGMLAMPRQRFILTNVGSALLWGPIVLLPGMAFGLSLELAAEFAGRLSLLLIIVLVLLWLAFWLIRQLYYFLVPRTDTLFSYVINWINRHPLIGRVPAALIDPRHPEMRILTLLALMLLAAAVAFTALSQFLTQHSLILGLNDLIYFQLQQLHNPPFDRVMLFFSHLGNELFLATLTLILFVWTALYRNWLAGWHLLAALALPLIVVHTLQLLFDVPRPDITASISSLEFPGAHITIATSVYGFIAVMLTRNMPTMLRISVYVISASLVLLIAFARLYLGIHWLSDVLGGILLGLIWVGFLGIGYRRHIGLPPLPLKTLNYPIPLILILLVTYPLSQLDKGLPAAVETTRYYRLGMTGWQQTGWQALQQYRSDLLQQQKYPLNLQWAAPRKTIITTLEELGWQQPDERRWRGWLQPSTQIEKLPVIPHLHEGRYENLLFVRFNNQTQQLLTVRLWQSDLFVQHNGQEVPLWIGEVAYLETVRIGPLKYLKTADDFNRALKNFLAVLTTRVLTTHHEAGEFQIILLRGKTGQEADAK
ncbi:MAG: VTT domain-containing protein, partial [Thiohalophilus sp.]|uniref:bifunctional DedA family/phosphatase PAP2 family protein n=1 Tax=Thiohalophilus sp. TaxID=3028392 RepID=UPI002870A41F